MVKFAVEFWWQMLLTIFPSKRSSKISFQTSPEVRHQFRRKLRQLHSGNRWCLNVPQKGVYTQKGVGHFFEFRSPFGNRFVTFLDAFGHFFAYPLLPPPFCGRVKTKEGPKRKVHEFRPFLCEFWCFCLGKQARFTSNFSSGLPRGKFMHWPFFGWVCRGDS